MKKDLAMQGTMMTIPPDISPEAVRIEVLNTPPSLDTLNELVGGYLEAVPGFTTILHNDKLQTCVALCNEDGRRLNLTKNTRASLAWYQALHRRKAPSMGDDLLGTIVVLFGDREFMEAL